jgi:hypothetical protein
MTFRKGGVGAVLNGCAGLHKSGSYLTLASRAALCLAILESLACYTGSSWESAQKCIRRFCVPALCATHATYVRSQNLRSATITKRATYNDVQKCK